MSCNMRLIDTRTSILKTVSPPKNPRYAILSHRWTDHEVTFADMKSRNSRKSRITSGQDNKFQGSLRQARADHFKFLWIDTCCIDRSDSVELSEAINSMYRWYRDAECCYVYLLDVDEVGWEKSFLKSDWFKRGWTLQELLAPQKVLFFDRHWRLLGDRKMLAHTISSITGIDVAALETGDISGYSVAQKMSWAARRVTTYPEDRAYCLLGLFDVNMPLLYGEGPRAFVRLQEEIIRYSDDHTIFAWSMGKKKFSGLLAPSPISFAGAARVASALYTTQRTPFSMTNRGLSIRLRITPWSADTYLAYLDCADSTDSGHNVQTGIFLRRLTEDDQYIRFNFSRKGLWLHTDPNHLKWDRPTKERQLFVRQTLDLEREKNCLKTFQYGFEISPGLLQSPATLLPADYLLNDCTAALHAGKWGLTAIIDRSLRSKGIRGVALGFDFDFNPICLLLDSSENNTAEDLRDFYDWTRVHPHDAEWEEVIECEHVYRKSNHKGIWALQGNRSKGLTVMLSKSFNDEGVLLKLERLRSRNRHIWTIKIDNLVGPLRNQYHRELRSSFRDRENFQRAYGLDMTEEELAEGDNILKAMFPPLSDSGPLPEAFIQPL